MVRGINQVLGLGIHKIFTYKMDNQQEPTV